MSDHYFSEEPQTPHDIKYLNYTYKGWEIKLKTDSGVFSKGRIDPGSKLLLDTVLVPAQGKLLDLGSGYGVIGICLAKANPNLFVHMVDINKRAVELAAHNIAINSLANCQVSRGDGLEGTKRLYDVIVTNPPIRAGKKTVYRFFTESKDFLASKGAFYTVIQKKQGGNSAINKLREIYGNCEKVNRSGGYWILLSYKENENDGDLHL